jgi:predicted  nucleic acid-binding Zn-ribbon protein
MHYQHPQHSFEILYPQDRMNADSYSVPPLSHSNFEAELHQAQGEINRLNSMVYTLEGQIIDLETEISELKQQLEKQVERQQKQLVAQKVQTQQEKNTSWNVEFSERSKSSSSNVRLGDTCL